MLKRTAVRIVLCLFLGFSLSACAKSRPDVAADAPSPAHAVKLTELAKQHALTLSHNAENSRILLSGRGMQVVLADGLTVAVVNGKSVTLPKAPFSQGGEVYLPSEAVKALPHLFQNRRLVQATVVIDPGHGGKDPGTNGSGYKEKDLVLDIGKRTAAALRKHGVKVAMTREDDRFIELADRVAFGKRAKAEAFVSIHLNAAAAGVSGVETYFNGAQHPDGLRLASHVHRALLARTQAPDRKVRDCRFYVVKNASGYPSSLVEVGYLSHPGSARLLGQASYRQLAADAIAEGIVSYLSARDR